MLFPKLAAAAAALGALIGASILSAPVQAEDDMPRYALAIHGGAGTIKRENLSEEKEAEYRGKLMEALGAGEGVLKDGGSSIDAVVAAIMVMENSPLFNAGKGAVFTAEGKNELDTSIMDGSTLNAGAAAGVTHVKNPILLARAVMENSPHVMLQGAGAEEFAKEQGLELVDPSYFFTEERYRQLQTAQQKKVGVVTEFWDGHFGTVGAVALDTHGNLAAGTSTGGMTNKMWGRVGDSPIIGAGTYANNASCAVSGTGHGEFYIRATVARDICAQMEYADKTLQEAADFIVMDRLVKMGGEGGIISVDKDGNIALVFNSPGMYRGSVRAGEAPTVAIFRE